MKILFVSPVGSFFSGAEIAIANLMSFLSDQGHQIYNVIPDNLSNRDEDYIKYMQENAVTLYQLPNMKWWWVESSNMYSDYETAVKSYQHKNIAEVREIISNENIDLVISNTVNVFQGAIAAACEKVPHYYIIHEFPFGEFEYYKEKIPLINQLSDKIFVVEGELYRTLLDYFPNDKLIPFIPYTAVESQLFQKGDTTRIVSIGGVTERKNQLELIKAYNRLDNKDLELIFIGNWDEEYKMLCDQYIEKNNLSGVMFLGYQSNPWRFVSNKDIIVFTSKLEAFPLVYVESILNGVPSIVSDNVGHLSVASYFQTNNFYPLGDIATLSKMISDTISNFSEFKRVAVEKSLSAKANYTLENVSQVFVENLKMVDSRHDTKIVTLLKEQLGLNLEEEFLELIKGNVITVYFSDEDGRYSHSRQVVHQLKQSDSFEISIKGVKSIRIDLTEHPSIFKNVKLKTLDDTQYCIPKLYKGYKRENNMFFYGNDHFLEYDVQNMKADKMIFSYSKVKNDFYGEFLGQELVEATSKIAFLQSQYDEFYHKYNSVIHSRRWTIPTKIINFFRRNK